MALTAFGAGVHAGYAQGDSHTFPETGKTVSGPFLTYWTQHGGLAQQGYPISDEMQQVSPTDGKTYTVQYFERAVFEEHPEYAGTSNEVLLSLLGVFRYQQKYPGGAPSQSPNNEANSQSFPQTGHRVGGKFLDYWNQHGGLAQQGYPISDEFVEISSQDGKPYKVQYFERAEFEEHPEFAGTPNEVLLSQLGTFAWQTKNATPTPTATPTSRPPTATPARPTPTVVQPTPCDQGVPDAKDATVSPKCGPIGTVFQISAHGFEPNEQISFWITLPDQTVLGTVRPVDIGNHPGSFSDRFDSRQVAALGARANGIWAITYQGKSSGHQSVVWFKIDAGNTAPTPTPGGGTCDTSGSQNGTATPNSGGNGTTIVFRATGFSPREGISFWFTDPHGNTVGTARPLPPGLVNSDGSLGPLPLTLDSSFTSDPGRWAITFEGASTHHQAIIYFCVHQ
jgi:hypothetical protein